MFPLDHVRHPSPPRIAVRAERTRLDPLTGDSRTWEAEVYLRLDRKATGEIFVRMDGGPTGNESFQVTADIARSMQHKCWVACHGGNGWDRLVVPCNEMNKFFGCVGLIVSEAA